MYLRARVGVRVRPRLEIDHMRQSPGESAVPSFALVAVSQKSASEVCVYLGVRGWCRKWRGWTLA